MNGAKSSFRKVLSGVPQGTVLGPILFIIYVADLHLQVQNSRTSTFADDTKISKAISFGAGAQSESELQEDLDKVFEWSITNSMVLHEDKFEVLHYSLYIPDSLSSLPTVVQHRCYLTPGGNYINSGHQVRDLGIIMSDDGSWTQHIDKIASDARKIAGWALRTFQDKSITTMMTLYKSLIRCKLEYCLPLWNPRKISDIQSLESVQRKFTRRVDNMKQYSYWDRLKKLNLMSLQRRRERYTIIHTWKMYNEVAPNSTNTRFYMNDEVPSLFSGARGTVKTKFFDSFAIKAARLWNTLPKKVNTADDLDQFKNLLGRWLDQFPDCPPVTGYPTQNTNSILDWVLEVRAERGMC